MLIEAATRHPSLDYFIFWGSLTLKPLTGNGTRCYQPQEMTHHPPLSHASATCYMYPVSCIPRPHVYWCVFVPYGTWVWGMGVWDVGGHSGWSYADQTERGSPPHLRCGPCGAGRRGTSGGTSPPSPPPGRTRSSPGPTLPGVKGHTAVVNMPPLAG